jgi:hypothetical protein
LGGYANEEWKEKDIQKGLLSLYLKLKEIPKILFALEKVLGLIKSHLPS